MSLKQFVIKPSRVDDRFACVGTTLTNKFNIATKCNLIDVGFKYRS